MRMAGSRKGAALLWAIVLCLIAGVVVNVLAVHQGRCVRSGEERWEETAALLEARGGVRWAAARLERGEPAELLVRQDLDGLLRVSAGPDRIESTYTCPGFEGRTLTVRVTAQWRRDGRIRLDYWTED